MIADIDRGCNVQPARRFGVLVVIVANRLSRRAGVGVAVRIIGHVLPAADVRAVLSLLPGLVV